MKITFLGTGTSQGIPQIACQCPVCTSIDFRDQRLRSSVMITVDQLNFVIDTGPDFRQQMLRERISRLDAVLFTHQHKDHTAGLDDIRRYNFIQEKAMPIYGTKDVIEQLQREFAYIFDDNKYPGVPSVEVYTIQNRPFQVQEVPILPIQVWHLNLPVFGFRIKDFTYITDANRIEEEEIEKIKGTKILVLNALQKDPHVSHFTLEEAIAVAEKIKPEKVFFTHISHKLGLHTEVERELPDGIYLAYDGLSINLDEAN